MNYVSVEQGAGDTHPAQIPCLCDQYPLCLSLLVCKTVNDRVPTMRSNTNATSRSVLRFRVVTVTVLLSPLLSRWGD